MTYGIGLLLYLGSINAKAVDLKATTTDGKAVLLHDNGTWEFVLPRRSCFNFVSIYKMLMDVTAHTLQHHNLSNHLE